MSILVDKDTRLLVQGITGREGSFHTAQMVEYGTNVVAGVTPGGGGKTVAGVPVFDTVAEAVAATRPNASIIYVPARFAPDAIYEAVDAGDPVRRLHHRGHPDRRHGPGLRLRPAARARGCSGRTAPG